ncbi:hypothetical protein SAMN05443550_104200 [Pedobacter hartonius]|uniref:Uncharacterized protein n=1 Tax=Pedobacter hartonius TaxID=425514 RepID=A0A1H4CUG0_9SPHI|nr:hypothetical protein SAMN05443550_104200 [Pedobacter hartonius]
MIALLLFAGLRRCSLKTMKTVYRNYSAKFIIIFLGGMLLLISILYLVQNGYVILKW